jgi:hypothetical protein
MGRKYKKNGVEVSTALNKNKKYKYDSTGDLVEATGTIGANEITLSGSKSNLRRMADIERNISILATTLMTTDGTADDGSNSSFGSNVNQSTRFKKAVRIDKVLTMNDNIDMNNKKLLDLADPTSAQHAATKAYVDARETSAEATAAADATSKANAAQSAAQSFATTAVSNLVNGASSAFNTLKEIQDAMATDAELTAAINGLTIGNGTVTMSAGAGMTGGGAFSMNQTGSETVTMNVIGGNGITVSADAVTMSGSYTGSFTATGDITAYSDESLKTNIQTIDGALGKVEAVRGVTFDRIEDGSTSTGVVAQELLAVLPEAVHTDANGVHSVAYGNITGLLIEAVKELSAEVKELKNM